MATPILSTPETRGPAARNTNTPRVPSRPSLVALEGGGVQARVERPGPVAPVAEPTVEPLLGVDVRRRVLDLALLVCAAPVVLALVAMIALAMALESRGRAPVWFAQTRVGRGGQLFRMYKFRTMVPHAEQVLAAYLAGNDEAAREWHAVQKLRNDPRVTQLGRLLRKTSLDELPQLWNVLRGEMSLVGPRPLVEGEGARYGASYAEYLCVRPGLTGLWQVSGRNDTTYAQRVEMDVTYVRTRSMVRDLTIIAKTPVVLFTGRGAY